MQAEFRAPKRRARVYEEYEVPLPVYRSPGQRGDLRADILNQHVMVCNPEDISKIYSQGYFGKGVLSRARPDHSISDQWEQHEDVMLPLISQARYDELLQWAGFTLSAQGLDKDSVSQTLERLSQQVEIEEVRGKVGGEENGQRGEDEKEEEPETGAGAGPHAKRSLMEGEEPETSAGAGPHAKRSLMEGEEPETSAGAGPHAKRSLMEGEGPETSAGAGPHAKRSLMEGEEPETSAGAGPHAKRSLMEGEEPGSRGNCRMKHQHLSPEHDTDSDPDSGSHPGSLVPGPGFFLVVSDSEECKGVRTVRQSPLSLTEYLQLSPEEAFFLVYSLGCLSVYLHQEPLPILQLWRKFRSMRPDFVSSFAAYQHFRSKGWIPKLGGGAKYGVDLMLYRKGPPFYHASYSVAVERVDDEFRGSGPRQFSWRSLAALSRITANVSKELMFCYIIYPTDLSEAELDSPACLSRLKVQEVIVNRWVSSRERAEQDDI